MDLRRNVKILRAAGLDGTDPCGVQICDQAEPTFKAVAVTPDAVNPTDAEDAVFKHAADNQRNVMSVRTATFHRSSIGIRSVHGRHLSPSTSERSPDAVHPD